MNPRAAIEMHEHHLPHWQQGSVYYFVTWRLADAIPQVKLRQWQAEKDAWRIAHPEPWDEATEMEFHRRFSAKIEKWLDAGIGSCVLRNPKLAALVARTLLHFDGERYDIDSFVVMPNHVHALFRMGDGQRLEETMKSWKGVSSRGINKALGERGTLWQQDYFDRMIRNERHFYACREYILENPTKANLPVGSYILYQKEGGHSCPPSSD